MIITPDGSTIYGTVPESNEVVKINTANLTVSTVATGLPYPQGLALHPDGQMLYVSAVNGVHMVKISDGSVVKSNLEATRNLPLAVNSAGEYLYLLGDWVDVLDAQSLSKVHQYLHTVNAWGPDSFLNNNTSELIYADGRVYSAAPPWHLTDLLAEQVTLAGTSQDGKMAFGFRSTYLDSSTQRELIVYEKIGLTWQATAHADLTKYGRIKEAYAAADGQKVCFLGSLEGILAAGRNCDLRAGSGDALRDCLANTACSADYDGIFTFQVEQIHDGVHSFIKICEFILHLNFSFVNLFQKTKQE
jgi:hypothetical protein